MGLADRGNFLSKNTTNGVYFRREDYAGFWLRFFVDVIDVLVITAVCSVLAIALWTEFPSITWILDLFLAICAIVVLCYFGVLKGSKLSTLGYWLCRVRIVDLNGRRAKFSSLTFRTLFAVLGPLSWLDSI